VNKLTKEDDLQNIINTIKTTVLLNYRCMTPYIELVIDNLNEVISELYDVDEDSFSSMRYVINNSYELLNELKDVLVSFQENNYNFYHKSDLKK